MDITFTPFFHPRLGEFVHVLWFLNDTENTVVRFYNENAASSNAWKAKFVAGGPENGGASSWNSDAPGGDSISFHFEPDSVEGFPFIDVDAITASLEGTTTAASLSTTLALVPSCLYNKCAYVKDLNPEALTANVLPAWKSMVRLEDSYIHKPVGNVTFTIDSENASLNSVVDDTPSLLVKASYDNGQNVATIETDLASEVNQTINTGPQQDITSYVEALEQFTIIMAITHHVPLYDSLPEGAEPIMECLGKQLLPEATIINIVRPWWWYTANANKDNEQAALNDIENTMIDYEFASKMETEEGSPLDTVRVTGVTAFTKSAHQPTTFLAKTDMKPLPDSIQNQQPISSMFSSMKALCMEVPGFSGSQARCSVALTPVLKGRSCIAEDWTEPTETWDKTMGFQIQAGLPLEVQKNALNSGSESYKLRVLVLPSENSTMKHITNTVLACDMAVHQFTNTEVTYPLNRGFSPLLNRAINYTESDSLFTSSSTDTVPSGSTAWEYKFNVAIRSNDVTSIRQLYSDAAFYIIMPNDMVDGYPRYTKLTLTTTPDWASESANVPEFGNYFGLSLSDYSENATAALQGSLERPRDDRGSTSNAYLVCLPSGLIENAKAATVLLGIMQLYQNRSTLELSDAQTDVLRAAMNLMVPLRLYAPPADAAYRASATTLKQTMFAYNWTRSWMEPLDIETTLLPSGQAVGPRSMLPLLSLSDAFTDNLATLTASLHRIKAFVNYVTSTSEMPPTFTFEELRDDYDAIQIQSTRGFIASTQDMILRFPRPQGQVYRTWVAVLKQEFTNGSSLLNQILVPTQLTGNSNVEFSLTLEDILFQNTENFRLDFYVADADLYQLILNSDTRLDYQPQLTSPIFSMVSYGAGTSLALTAPKRKRGSRKGKAAKLHAPGKRGVSIKNAPTLFSLQFLDSSGALQFSSDSQQFYLTTTDEGKLAAFIANSIAKPKKGLSGGAIAGITIGSCLGAFAIIGGGIYAAKKAKASKKKTAIRGGSTALPGGYTLR